MAAIGVLIGLFVLASVLMGPVLALWALARLAQLRAELGELRITLKAMEARMAHGSVMPSAEPQPSVRVTAPVSPQTTPPIPSGAPSPPPRTATPAPPRPPSPPRPPTDFATTLGPKLLVAVGALAVVAALGFFMKYAWENNWIGATGRVLFGVIVSLGCAAGGIRLLRGAYRPLGQGLMGAGLAGLYLCAYGATVFHALIPRELAGIFMAVLTVNALLLAIRLDARLFATLAWIGGYMTPVVLSTGVDHAVALCAYLTLLDLGAIAIDRRKPWPETLALAFAGTWLLEAAWFVRFFSPSRVAISASVIMLFTALFAVAWFHRRRTLGVAMSSIAGAMAIAYLSAAVDRPEVSLFLSLTLAAAALSSTYTLGALQATAAALAVGLPFLAWTSHFYRAEAFGIASAWIVGAGLLFALPALMDHLVVPVVIEAAIFSGGLLAAVVLAADTNAPRGLLALLVAQAGLAVLVRRRWAWAQPVGIAGASLAALAWMDRYFRPPDTHDAIALALAVGGTYLASVIVRALIQGVDVGTPGVMTHVASAAFVWSMLYRVLYRVHPDRLAFASIALGAVELTIGLVFLRMRRSELRQRRVALGLAAGFLTIAIPVQLGLHGITLAWAFEGVLLVWLGRRFASSRTRLGGYAVLALAVLRLLVRHTPMHVGTFRPFLNPSFGTWLAVLAALVIALAVVRGIEAFAGDGAFRRAASVVAVALLFGLLTGETRASFDQTAQIAAAAADPDAFQRAHLMGSLAISVLWTLFATGLLASGLALRHRPLFYAAYALFAVTAAKVALWDLATLQTPYRILSFLALGVLLLAGAYLNLRFRGRLLPRQTE